MAYKSGFFTNMPEPVELDHQCVICWMTRSNRIPRGLAVEWAQIKAGVRYHIDIWFSNVPSSRGNTACITIVEGKTSLMTMIPVRSKRPPIAILLNYIEICRRAGLPFAEIRVDEDGAFIRSTKWCEAMAKLGIAVQSTSGYNSENNGQVEVVHREIGKAVRTCLAASGLPDKLWDFAVIECAHRHNLQWNSGKKGIPLQNLYQELGVGDKKVDYNSLILFGSRLYSVACPKKKNLEMRTTRNDPRDHTDRYPSPRNLEVNNDENAVPQSTLHYVGSGNHFRSLKAYDSSTGRILTVMHAGVDEAGITISPNEPMALNHHLIQSSLAGAPPTESLPPMRTVCSKLVLQQKPSFSSDATEYEISLPPKGIALGIAFDLDDATAVPYIVKIPGISPLYEQVEEVHRHGAFV